jgi:integrase
MSGRLDLNQRPLGPEPGGLLDFPGKNAYIGYDFRLFNLQIVTKKRNHGTGDQADVAGRPGRWRKVYKGKAYVFPGGRVKSDMEAYDAALAAWEAKKREIDLAEDRVHEPACVRCMDQWSQVLIWSLQHGETHWAKRAEDKLADLRRRLGETKLQPLRDGDWFEYALDPLGSPGWQQTVESLASQLWPDKPADSGGPICNPGDVFDRAARVDSRAQVTVWRDRLASAKMKAAPVGDSVHENVKAFLETREARVKANKLSVARLVALRTHLEGFEKWIGGTTSIKEIDGPRLIKYKIHVDTQCQTRTAGHKLEAVKTWVKWLWATEAIESLPRAFQSGELKIEKPVNDIKTFAISEVKQLLAKASQRTRLYCLLGLNCGMYQIDIANLNRGEVDLAAGTIKRKRSKTKKKKNVPTVTYRLWNKTLRLLSAEMATEGELALVGENGKPLMSLGVDGKKTDAVKSAFFRLLKRPG